LDLSCYILRDNIIGGANYMLSYEALRSGKDKIAVIGLGYVGLPLAVHLSRFFSVVGYDRSLERIHELTSGKDRTLEVSDEELANADMEFSSEPDVLARCRLIIVAVPTPIDGHRIPDLRPVCSASEAAGTYLQKGACVVYESTVYPGVTEDVCVPILEETSGLTLGRDFTVGYSPERINPGDTEHTLDKIVKVVSGSDDGTTDLLTRVYGAVVPAGIYPVTSIKVAEAAKVIENTQRDLNIALMNELAMIFDKLGIDTQEVLNAAGTKWNFLPFRPGLVGGHCIGVDPYYLTFKAEALGYHPEMILAGRRINDGMGKYIAERAIKLLIKAGKQVRAARAAVLGVTFKENVPDLRNTRVVDIIRELEEYGLEVLVNDPFADPDEARKYYDVDLVEMDDLSGVDVVIVAVMHGTYRDLGLGGIARLVSGSPAIVVDVKSAFARKEAERLGVLLDRI